MKTGTDSIDRCFYASCREFSFIVMKLQHAEEVAMQPCNLKAQENGGNVCCGFECDDEHADNVLWDLFVRLFSILLFIIRIGWLCCCWRVMADREGWRLIIDHAQMNRTWEQHEPKLAVAVSPVSPVISCIYFITSYNFQPNSPTKFVRSMFYDCCVT